MSNQTRLGKMPPWQRHFVMWGMLSCSLTGLAYLIGHEFQIQRMIFGNHTVLAWHGVSAMIAILAFGSILPFHIKAGLKSQRKRWSGLSQLGFLALLIGSGALLYYGPEEIRDTVIMCHWIGGVAFLAIFMAHGVFMAKMRASK